MENGEKIYKNLKDEMKKQKLNQSDIANILGMTRANVSMIFSRMKKNKISYKNTINIAKILKNFMILLWK